MSITVNGKKVAGRGIPGKSPYQIATEGGFSGTESEFNQILSNALVSPEGGTEGQVLTKTQTGQEWADGGMTEVEADGRYLKLGGGTMTGPIVANTNNEFVSLPNTKTPMEGGEGFWIEFREDENGAGSISFCPRVPGLATRDITIDYNGIDLDGPNSNGGGCAIRNLQGPYSDTDAANKAYVDSKAPTGQTVTLTSSGWTSTTGGFQQVVSVTGVTTDPDQIIWVDVSQSGTDLAADKALNDAWGAGPGQLKPKQQSGALQFFSIEKPTVNIPVDVVVSG